MKNIILLLMENETKTYHQSKNERKKIHDIAWEEDDECEVLGELVMRSADFNGILSCIKSDTCTNIKSKINFLKNASIYNNNCIVEWINQYSERFPKYWCHMKTLENLRIVGLLYLEKKLDKS